MSCRVVNNLRALWSSEIRTNVLQRGCMNLGFTLLVFTSLNLSKFGNMAERDVRQKKRPERAGTRPVAAEVVPTSGDVMS